MNLTGAKGPRQNRRANTGRSVKKIKCKKRQSKQHGVTLGDCGTGGEAWKDEGSHFEALTRIGRTSKLNERRVKKCKIDV